MYLVWSRDSCRPPVPSDWRVIVTTMWMLCAGWCSSEMITQTATCFGIKPNLQQRLPEAGFETRCCFSSCLLLTNVPHGTEKPLHPLPGYAHLPPALPPAWCQGQGCKLDLVLLWYPLPGLQLCCYIAVKSETDSLSFGFQTGTSVFWDFTNKPSQQLTIS